MLISHSKKFIFIHVYKVAGTSIRNALHRYCDHSPPKMNPIKMVETMVGFRPRIYSKDFDGHITARELEGKLPAEIFKKYFKFAFVRNPWDWQVSLYEYAMQNEQHRQHEMTRGFKSFEEYIDWRIDGNFKLQSDFLTNTKGEIIVDQIGRLEDIEKDFEAICRHIGIDSPRLTKANSTRRKHYSEYYNASTIEKIRSTFEKDIDRFGYGFESY